MNTPSPSGMGEHDIHAFGRAPALAASQNVTAVRAGARRHRALWWALALVLLLGLWLCVAVVGALIDTAPAGLQVVLDGEPVFLGETWQGRGWAVGLVAVVTAGVVLLVVALVVPLVLLSVAGALALVLLLTVLAVAGSVATGVGAVLLVLALVLSPLWLMLWLLWLLLRRPRAPAAAGPAANAG